MDENTEAQRGEATHPRMDGSSLAEPYFPRGTLVGRRAWPMKKTNDMRYSQKNFYFHGGGLPQHICPFLYNGICICQLGV